MFWGAVLCASPVYALDETDAGYQSLIDEGVREFGAGNYVEARSLFERAHARVPNARTYRALGLCAFELKHYVQAEDELAAALRDPHNALTPDLARSVESTLERARGFVGQLQLRSDPVDSRLLIDGQEREGRVFRLDAGEHLLTASAPGYHSRDLRLSISGLQTQRLELVLTPVQRDVLPPAAASMRDVPSAAPSLAERWWYWAAIGVVAAGAAVALVVATRPGEPAPSGTSGITLHGL